MIQSCHEERQIVRVYSLWFLNRHLKGSAEPMPDAKKCPRIVDFLQK